MKKQIAWILCLAFLIVLLTSCNRADKTEPTDPHKETQAAAVQTEQPTEITATQIAKEPTAPEATQAIVSQTDEATEYEEPTEERAMALRMTIGDTPVSVAWEDGDAIEALRELCRENPLTIDMSMYGGFEQVGSLGMSLPRSDTRITTAPGDVILYSGNQMVVFYGSNTWAYTRLGHITDQTTQELTQLLSNGDVTITLSY